jgi:hypothetical protein
MAREIDWQLFEKAIDLTASAVRGSLGGENSQPPGYAADVFREVWTALKEASHDLPEKPKTGFGD